MIVRSVKRIRAITLAGIFCLGLLVSSCSHLERITDDLFSIPSLGEDHPSWKKIPMPQTTKDFESEMPEPGFE